MAQNDESFENVIEILLRPLSSPDASCVKHRLRPLLKCVYCDDFLCLSCFADPIHLHELIPM